MKKIAKEKFENNLDKDKQSSLAMSNYNEPNISLTPKIIYIYKLWSVL
jgi:hypothetical protein